ncbi:MAG: ThuA domain-containing protein [Chloroflexota bacterium]
MKNILLVTDGIFHPPLLGRLRLHKMFSQMGGFSFEHISSLEKLPTDLTSVSALVLHFHHKTISSSALERLDTFVKNGGGILAIHAATASFKQTLPYFKIIGGRFIGHGAVERFKVERVKDEIFDGIDDFEVRDELYIHELEPGIEVHFTAKHEGKDIPVVWTYLYGKGKVCYAVPGHTTGTMVNKTYQEVLKRGLEWICS